MGFEFFNVSLGRACPYSTQPICRVSFAKWSECRVQVFRVVIDSVRNYGFDFIRAIMADFMEQSVYMTFVFLPDIHI